MNSTLVETRNNTHDRYLKSFMNEQGLIGKMDSDEKTFMSDNDRGSSQFDYILCSTPGTLKSVVVEEKHFLNQSAHTSVCAILNISSPPKQKVTCNKRTFSKPNWDKLDENKFQQSLNIAIEGLSKAWSSQPKESQLQLTECL